VVDDFGRLKGPHKLLGQTVPLAWSGVSGFRSSRSTCSVAHELGLLGLPFTAFLLLGAINSLIVLDGMTAC